MPKTPHYLQQHGIPEHTSSRKLPAFWLGYCGESKKEFLSLIWVMTMVGALEEYGADSSHIRRRSQEYMALILGIDRSTFNRRLAKYSFPDGRWSDERLCRHSELKRAEAAKRAGPEAGPGNSGPAPQRRARRQIKRVHAFFHKNASFGQAQLYSLNMSQKLKPKLEKKAGKTTNVELAAAAFGEQWFDRTMDGVNNWKDVPGWIWHPNLPDADKCSCQAGQMGLHPGECQKCKGTGTIIYKDPLPDYGRNLITFLLLKGLKQRGSLVITQEAIAKALGMDVNTVAKYEDKLEALMIIRCIPGAVHRDCLNCAINYVDHCPKCGSNSGPITRRDPHKILWLPDRLMDEEIVQREWNRFNALREKIRDREIFKRAERIEVALLKEWRGHEHSLEAFWNEMRRRLAAENLNKSVIDVLFPFFRE